MNHFNKILAITFSEILIFTQITPTQAQDAFLLALIGGVGALIPKFLYDLFKNHQE